MKKITSIFLALVLFGCSAEVAPGETFNSETQSLDTVFGSTTGTCTRPTGGGTPVDTRNITSVYRVPGSPHLFRYQTTDLAAPYTVRTQEVNFGVGQAYIMGVGWTGPKLTQIVVSQYCDPADSRYICIIFRGTGSEDGWLKFRNDYSAPAQQGTFNIGTMFAIQGVGTSIPQGLRFWGRGTSETFSDTFIFDGPALNACSSP